ncbi:MAG: lipopolysaccharide biosynthesis protein [Methylophaga sp.]|nr:lipopolysaccharide biosynthesis protein [Methylophaga sp.]
MTSLAQKTLTGLIWNLAEQFTVRGITVIVTLLLAYFLSPEDFGLLAMMVVFISIASALMDSGFKQALIRLPEATQVDFNTAFYANIVLGIISYLILFAAAPSIAGFYEEERLITLIRVAGLVVIINAFQVVQYARLSRALNFKVQFRAAFPASILSALVAITMAYLGFGVWALIAQMLVSAFVVTLCLWWQKIWRPTLSWSANSLKSMYDFGYKLFLSSLLDTGFKNMYVVVIAKLFTTSLAGLYFFADRIRELVIYQIVSAVQKVTYPALATLQQEPTRLKQGYKKVIAVTTFILFPLILFIAALAESIFHLLLPEKWWPASFYLQLMCLAGVLIPVHAINLNILQVLGRSDLFLWLEIIKKSIAVLILVISFRFGIIGILIGQIISSVLAYLPNSYYSKRLIDYPVSEQLTDFLPCLLLAGGIGIVIWWLQAALQWPDFIKLIVLAALAVSAYVIGAWLLRLHALELAQRLIVNRLKGKAA